MEAEDPMGLWIDLCLEFDFAYGKEPPDAALIERIYRFAFWCLEHSERDEDARYDLPTCVVTCLYENIPTNKAAREEMPRWFVREEVVAMKSIFSYHLEEGEFEALLALFDGAPSVRQRKREQRARRRLERREQVTRRRKGAR